MRKFAHIVNLGIFPETSDLHIAQPITVETMRIAKEFAVGQADVALLSAQYPEDRRAVPNYFTVTPDLTRSVLDFADFKVRRKLPLIKDILDRACDAAESDYIVYSNVDIGLLPHFYVTLNRIIESGIDAFIINRRLIAKEFTKLEDIPLMWAEVGRPHMGYDCFVFKRDVYPKFDLGLTCIGASYYDKLLLGNLLLYSSNFKVFRDHHLTFHIGNDKTWTSKAHEDYQSYNKAALDKFVAGLDAEKGTLVQRTLAENRRRGLRKKFADYLGARW